MQRAPQEIRTYFITSVTANRRRLFQIDQNANLFIDILQEQRTRSRLQLHAFVVMPDHTHLLLTPAPDISLEKAMQYIKGGFSFRLKSKLNVWERSYDSRRIRRRSLQQSPHLHSSKPDPRKPGKRARTLPPLLRQFNPHLRPRADALRLTAIPQFRNNLPNSLPSLILPIRRKTNRPHPGMPTPAIPLTNLSQIH
jgi:REP element-mobilizing transposase RayT